jgi:hypothetical protein
VSSLDENVVVPVVEAVEDLPILVAGMVGPDDAPHGRALDRLADPDRRHVGLLAVESRADGRLDGEVEVADEDLPDARLGHLDGTISKLSGRGTCAPASSAARRGDCSLGPLLSTCLGASVYLN